MVEKDGKKFLVKPDHYTIILKFKDIPTNRDNLENKDEARFNLKKDGGWDSYKELTENCEELLAIVNDNEATIEEIYERFDKIHKKIKFKSFGKTRITKGCYENKKNVVDDHNIVDKLSKQKSGRLEKEIQALKSCSNSRPTRVFKLIEKIQGPKKAGLEAVAIVDPVTDELKTSKNEIKETTLKYCADLLTNNPVEEGYRKDIIIKNKLHEARMGEDIPNDEKFNDEDFQNALKRFSSKNKACYDFLTKAGKDFQQATQILMERIWESEYIPDGWKYTMLIMLYKGRGLKEVMDNNRFIHSKDWMPRFFEDLVVSKMKNKVNKKTTKYQIGGMKGHRSSEHLFSVKSIIAYYAFMDWPLLIQCIDIRKFFDKENLRDAMCALYSAGVCGKVYRLWFKLNENTRIAVKTGVGLTDERETGETLGQGTVGGALASALNIDEELDCHFEDSPVEICYGSTRLQPISFQDDVLRMCTGRDEAQEGFNRMEAVFKSKLLEIHPTKSCYLLFANNSKMRNRIQSEIADRPLTYDTFTVTGKSEEKWLGDILSNGGQEKSIEATINNRYGKITGAIFELKAVIEDLRMQSIGGIKCGIDIWEMSFIPSLLNNSGTWASISDSSVEKLNSLQNTFLQTLLAVGRSCPKPALCWDTATPMMQIRIEKSKLALLFHIKNLDDSSLAKQIYSEQLNSGWPGLLRDCENILERWDVPNILHENHQLSKYQWKTIINKEAKIQNGKLLADMMKNGYSKLEVMKREAYEEKTYLKEMPMYNARINFSLRARTFPCKMNTMNNPKFKADMWRCDSCESCIDSQSHILYCPAYKELREGRTLSSDDDIVSYFRDVLAIRIKLDLNR